jgi:hypothetical protein
MTPRGQKYILGCGSIAFLLIALLVAGVYGYGMYKRNSNEREALAIAQQLGMQSDDRLLARRKCWALGTECGQTIIFTTRLTQDALRTQISALGFNERFAQQTGGNKIFSAINIGTEHTFTADGNDDSGSLPYEKVPSGWIWSLARSAKGRVSITFYETSSKPVVYAFDGRPIRENIIELLLWDSNY